jgi:anti-sigma factor RsiW
MSTHLKPEQFDDLLMGIAESESSAHLSACPQCRAELEAMRGTLGAFRGAAVGWSESAAKQVELPKRQRMISLWARPAWVLAAIILLAVTIPDGAWRVNVGTPSVSAEAQAQISRDNDLLARIESEVGSTTPATMHPLQVNP